MKLGHAVSMWWTCGEYVWTCGEHVVNMCEHVVNIWWTCSKHAVSMWWTCGEHAMNILWYHEHVVNMLWISREHFVNMSWKCHEYVMNTSWTCLKHGMSWTYRKHVVERGGDPPPPIYHMTIHYVLRSYFQEFSNLAIYEISRKIPNCQRQTDGQTDRRTDGQTKWGIEERARLLKII